MPQIEMFTLRNIPEMHIGLRQINVSRHSCIHVATVSPDICGRPFLWERSRAVTRPIPDKAEIALEYPNKFYIGTFERTARFGAHLDKAGVSLTLERTGDAAEKKAVRMHFHYALFAEILQELAKTASAMPEHDVDHREALRDGAKALYESLKGAHPASKKRGGDRMTPDEEVLLLHILE